MSINNFFKTALTILITLLLFNSCELLENEEEETNESKTTILFENNREDNITVFIGPWDISNLGNDYLKSFSLASGASQSISFPTSITTNIYIVKGDNQYWMAGDSNGDPLDFTLALDREYSFVFTADSSYRFYEVLDKGDSQGSAALSVTNSKGFPLTLYVGLWSDIAEQRIVYNTTELVDGEEVSLNLKIYESMNIWYEKTDGTITKLVNTSNDIMDFPIANGKGYELSLNDDNKFTFNAVNNTVIVTGEISQGFTTDDKVFLFLPGSRSEPTFDQSSKNAAGLIPKTVSVIIDTSIASYTKYHVKAVFEYSPGPDDLEYISFPEAQYSFLDQEGNVIYSSSMTSTPYVYLYANQVSRYEASTQSYNYGHYAAWEGDTVFLDRYFKVENTATDHPLYGFDVSTLGSIRFDLLAKDHTNLNHEKLGITNGVRVDGPSIEDNKMAFTLENLSPSETFDLTSGDKIHFLNADGFILDSDYMEYDNSVDDLILTPGEVLQVYSPLSAEAEVKSRITGGAYMIDYNEYSATGASRGDMTNTNLTGDELTAYHQKLADQITSTR